MKLKAIVLTVMLSAGLTYGQYDYGFDFSKTGSAGLQFLKIGVGARESAMGEAVAASVKDANAAFWNPAGLAYIDNYQAAFSHNNWLVDSRQIAASVAVPMGLFSLAVSAESFAVNEFEETTVTNPDGTGRMVSAGDMLIGVAAARRFTDRLSIGAQIKYVREKLDEYSIGNVLFDVGAMYTTGFRNLRLGFVLQHFGPDMKLVNQSFRTPLLFRVNATDEIVDFSNVSWTAAFELVHSTDNVEVVNIGTELKLYQMIFLRGGYRVNTDEGKMSLGFGIVSPEVSGMNLKFDYSFVRSEVVFQDIHRISVGFSF
ncbi:MAG: PorV/PorQ family protein [Syntrophomonadaceae bacterium]